MKQPATSRQRKLAEELRRRLSDLLREEVDHDAVWKVSIKDVEVARDLSRALVWVDFLGDPDEDLPEALVEASVRLRRRLGKTMHIRRAPELLFRHDDSAERGARISALIEQAVAEDRRRAGRGDHSQGED